MTRLSARKTLTRSQRARVFETHSGVCYLCGLRIRVGERWHVEHPQALGLGGADEPANQRPAHVVCHQDKTSVEKSRMAKADRAKWFHLGIRKPNRRPMSGWRKFDGTPVRNPRT